MLAQGIPVNVVSERLGHRDVTMTLDVYGPVLPGMQKEAVEAFVERFKSPPGGPDRGDCSSD